MTLSPTIVYHIIAAGVALGCVFIAVGVLKSKVNQNAEKTKAHEEQIKTLASKDELTAAIRRSDEMLAIMTQRADEDRHKGQGQWREFHNVLAKHAERIGALETQQNSLIKSLDEIKLDIKSGFRDVQNELKELRNVR